MPATCPGASFNLDGQHLIRPREIESPSALWVELVFFHHAGVQPVRPDMAGEESFNL
jgi:hypothetical protein